MKRNSLNKKGFASAYLAVAVLAVLLLVGSGLFYLKKVNNPQNPSNSPKQPEVVAPVKVSFSYKVKSISSEEIILNGLKGDFGLPNDPAFVLVYNGPTKSSPIMNLSDLKVGDNLNMEFVPGESAILFVSSI